MNKGYIAFVTGYIGTKNHTYIPNKPPQYDSYYITDNKWVYARLKRTQWMPIFIDDIMDILSKFLSNSHFIKNKNINKLDKVDKNRFYTIVSKPLKVYPDQFLPKGYHYIVWFDSKFDVNITGTLEAIRNWKQDKAIMLHKHPFAKNIEEEFNESMKQKRYVKERYQYIDYIYKNTTKGLSKYHNKHYQCGYLLYNTNHPETKNIQRTWQQHINNCGINDQISFNFIAQLFDKYIDEYIYDIQDL